MATRSGFSQWYPRVLDKFGTVTIFDLLIDYIKMDRIKLDKTKIKEKTAYNDPCNYGRKSEIKFGHGYYEEPRWILDQLIEDRIELHPATEHQYCCGGGGGTLLTGYDKERIYYGRKKIEQIKASGAELLVVPCHSCHGQINSLLKESKITDIKVKYLWEVVADCLIMK